jgi:flagellar motility protein MotE (MotC chaperone)
MIATRQRPFRLPIMAFIKVLAVFGIAYALVRVPVTHALIFDGPLKPVWKQTDGFEKKFIAPTVDPIFSPLAMLNMSRKLNARNGEIIALKKELAQAKLDAQAAQKNAVQLQKKIQAKAVTPAVAAAGGAAGANTQAASAAPSAASSAAPMVQITPSPDEVQTAAYWGSMEAENAAAIAQKLDPVETARIFLAMKPDQVAEIMNVLPAAYNVKLQAVHLSFPKPMV